MTASHWDGPLVSGDQPVGSTTPNQGVVQLAQFAGISWAASQLVNTVEIWVPTTQGSGARLSAFDVDVLTVYDSATSATFTAGITAGGTDYVSGVNVKASAGRIAITYTAAQLAAMAGLTATGGAAAIANPGPIFLTVTSVGQPTQGFVTVTVKYYQLQ